MLWWKIFDSSTAPYEKENEVLSHKHRYKKNQG